MELGDPMEVELESQPQRAASQAPSPGAPGNPRQPAAGGRPQAAAARLDAPETHARAPTTVKWRFKKYQHLKQQQLSGLGEHAPPPLPAAGRRAAVGSLRRFLAGQLLGAPDIHEPP
jgi:hypothetical protein